MNNSCDVIKDLLPLYHDGVSSEESNTLIENHLKNCEECRDYLDSISKEILSHNNKSEEEAKIHSLIKLRKKFRIKNIIILTVSTLCAVILFFLARNFMFYHEFTVNYKDGILSSEKIYSASDIMKNFDYYCAHIIYKDVEGQQVIYMYYTKTLLNDIPVACWRNRPYNTVNSFGHIVDWSEFEKQDGAMSDYETISAIYYFVGDYEKLIEMTDEEFFSATKDAVLIWEK